jgi:hypothetical protein
MDSTPLCPKCGKPLAPAAPRGLCPECLLKAGFPTDVSASGTAVVTSAGKRASFEPPTPAELAPLFPQLEILELIGQGGMGAVYRARQPALDRLVALKILPPHAGGERDFAERFNREARALAKLSHPNIVAVHDFGQAGGYHYLLMEFVDGVNLRHLLDAGRISPREALAIVPPICDALQFAHDQGIVHRDIKPENILLAKNGAVKIADFGLAKLVGADARGPALTGAGDVMGTPHYMAPEQVERPREVDHRADIYSLGVVLYQMLTGELPLGRFGPPSSRLHGVQIDVRIDEIVLRALEKEPALRYQQATTLKTEVETVARSSVHDGAEAGDPARGFIGHWRDFVAVVVRRGERAEINWPGVALGFAVANVVLVFAGAAATALLGPPKTFVMWIVVPLFALLVTGLRILRGRTMPAARLHVVATGLAAELRKSATYVVATVLLFFSAGVAASLPHGDPRPNTTVTGYVADAITNSPIAGARVADVNYNAGPRRASQEAWTNDTGQYSLGTWYEEHTISASAPGYEPQVKTLFTKLFRREGVVRMNFRLAPTQTASATADFEPVIERFVGDITAHQVPELISFETGQLVFQRDVLGEDTIGLTAARVAEIFRARGIDATGTLDPNTRGLVGWEICAVPVAAREFDRLSAADLRAALDGCQPGSPVAMPGTRPLPVTYAFKTRTGRVGLLQIRGYSEQPRGVPICYKLAVPERIRGR